MAWQLIYTSAPRLLEAGRSGFGTVARHRQISPLLVSAIERASQFARLPGLDAGRVVFAHRPITIGGGRFHVLSCIRDAGADYTGRTNHIAHHVIVEPREIARLGAEAPSPADVMLGMPWISEWHDHPRHFEAGDEVALTDFAAGGHTGGAHWAQLTGNPDHAWLLANGEASRGAYLITPEGVDLRPLFAESFRLIPDHAWQHGFVTSLQPSDEASDFRWIGVEENSPLLSHAASSARPLLDLTAPHRLPAPEIPAAAKSVSRESVSDFQTAENPEANPEPSRQTESRASRQGAAQPKAVKVAAAGNRPVARPRVLAGATAAPRGSSGVPKWMWITGLAVLAGAGLGAFALLPLVHRMSAQKKVATLLEPSGYFGDEPARIGIAREWVPDADAEPKVSPAARSADRLAWLLSSGDFDKLKSAQAAEDLHVLENDSAQLPAAIGKMRELAKRALALYEPPHAAEQAQDSATIDAIFKDRRTEISTFIGDTGRAAVLSKLLKELQAKTDRDEAKALLALVRKPILPAEGMKAFEKDVSEFSHRTNDSEALQTVSQVRELIAEKQKKPRLPAATPVAEAKPAVVAKESPPAPPVKKQGPIYLVAGNDALMTLKIKELHAGMSFYLTLPGAEKKELMATADKLRVDFQRPSAAFLNTPESQSLRAVDDAPNPPYKLAGESKDGAGFEIWVSPVNATDGLADLHDAGLARSADLLRVTGSLPKFLGVQALLLRLPQGIDGKMQSLTLPVNEAWEVDLAPIVAELHKSADALHADSKMLRQSVTASKSQPPSLEALQKKANEYARVFKDEHAKAELNPKAKNGYEIVGNYAVAIVTEWEKQYDQNLEDLRSWGHNLRESNGKPEVVRQINEGLKKEVAMLEQKYRASKMAAELANLRDLTYAFGMMMGDTKVTESAAKAMTERADANDTAAQTIEKLPLLADGKHPPAGDYVLVARAALNREVVIAILKIRKP